MNFSQIEKIDSILSAIKTRNLPFTLLSETGKNLAEINYRAINCGSGIKLLDTNTNRYYDCKGRDTIDFPVTISIGIAYRIIIDAIKAMASPIQSPFIEPVQSIETPMVETIAEQTNDPAIEINTVPAESTEPVQSIETPKLKKGGKKFSRKVKITS